MGDIMRNLLQIIDRSNSNGGAQKHTLLITKEFAKKGFNVWLICPPGPYVEEFRKLEKYNVKIIVIDMKKKLIKSILEIRKIVNDNKIELIHSHLLRSDLISAIVKITLKNKPIVFTTIHNILSEDVRGIKKYIYTKFAKFSFRYIDKAFTVSNDVKKTTIDYFSLSEEKVETILNGVDIDQFENLTKGSSRIREELNILENEKIVTSAGALINRKGQHVLIDAFKHSNDNMKLLLLGSGESEMSLLEQIRKENLVNKVFLLGHRNDVIEIINDSDIYIQPSLWDPLPRAMLEAMGLGIPTIASDVNGIPEVIEDYKTGLLVKPDNSQELKEKIDILINDDELRREISKSGQDFILHNCTTMKMCDEIISQLDLEI